MRHLDSLRALAACGIIAGAVIPTSAVHAQEQSADSPRITAGNVVRPDPSDSTAVLPVSAAWAVLHRVAGEGAGPVDSIRTTAAGRYQFSFPLRPSDSTAIYFVSAERGGVTYFAPPTPLAGANALGDTIVVFDTTSAPTELAVRSRHLLVGRPDSLDRYVILEVFELENTSRVTLVAPREGQWTWSIDLPQGARDVIPGQGDVSRDAMEVSDTSVRVVAPIAPGLKQVAFSYTLAAGDFPLSIPLMSAVEVFELLIEPPQATVEGARVVEVGTADVQGRSLRRYLADSVAAGSVVRIDLPSLQLSQRSIYVAALLVALGMVMLLSLGRSFQQRRRVGAHATVGGETPEQIAQRIVALDARFQRRRSPTDAEREEYDRARAALKDSLTDALVRRDEA